ncbi:UDP-4-amino-4,6-dideoxy-N-acetyl-beta-L-altrosamine transaminase [Castellaniella denitrificans]|uniref:UDP-4-amino-4, 6-dideoxy-N-acetyl-beta-L-altrosamine transaminase n=1 Tax=Castellaniella denitrificans TaxID=56119 RepID=A0ABT4LZS6_9BURK|nr:UDP-4-amino-4,6-dideoxy-N-acetyl-beta-L-altrosamine transaminase [Castellaniella denitrificans]MCZ4328567.1 UDP-4-amino-4,6-dideoxy-N-acetyl-beta-L-altrosamine transaminase [Castellaniella denitrificans]
MIPYGRQDITQADIDAVVDVLQSDFLTQGPRVPAFEQAIAAKVRAKYAVASNSATSALHLACLALGLGPGDLLWTSPITFVASANCALYCGAQVDFVDIDPLTYNMDVGALESKLIEADRIGRLPKIVVPVHLSGQSCDMEAIHVLADRYGFKIIEDASHAIGGKYQEQYVGVCQHSDITVFSFHPVKIITTAEGGMATTNSETLADQMKLLRSHGVTRDPSLMTHKPDGPWYYQQIALGLNYRMTELQAALGISQLERLDQYVTKRHEVARRYDLAFEGLPITIPVQHSGCYSAYHLYVIRLHLKDIKMAHGDVFEKLRGQGIGVNLHYIPVHIQPYYRNMGFRIGQFPEAEKYYREAISLPMYATLSHDEQLVIQNAVKSIIQ